MSAGYQPQPTAPVNTGAHSVVLRGERKPTIEHIRGSFESTFGAYVPADWTLDAECTAPGVDPVLFFPTKGGRQIEQRAKAICAVCSVRQECLDDALAFELGDEGSLDGVRPEVHGTRGGMVAKDRKKLVNKIAADRQEAKRKAVLEDYVTGELTVDKIAAKHHVAPSTVTRLATEAGVPMRPQGNQGHGTDPDSQTALSEHLRAALGTHDCPACRRAEIEATNARNEVKRISHQLARHANDQYGGRYRSELERAQTLLAEKESVRDAHADTCTYESDGAE